MQSVLYFVFFLFFFVLCLKLFIIVLAYDVCVLRTFLQYDTRGEDRRGQQIRLCGERKPCFIKDLFSLPCGKYLLYNRCLIIYDYWIVHSFAFYFSQVIVKHSNTVVNVVDVQLYRIHFVLIENQHQTRNMAQIDNLKYIHCPLYLEIHAGQAAIHVV